MSHLQLVERAAREVMLVDGEHEPEISEGADVIPLQKHPLVRRAEHEDAFAILDTLRDALDATETPLPDPEMPYAVQHLMDSIAQEFVAVAEAPDGAIVGCVVLAFGRWPWTSPNNRAGLHLTNEHFWVDPAHRRGGVAHKLIEFVKQRAINLNLPVVLEICCIDANTRLDPKDRFVANRGFKYLGGKFFWSPSGV